MSKPETVSFTVYGTPQPQGSTRAFLVGGRPRITSDNPKNKSWRQEVALCAMAAMAGKRKFARNEAVLVRAAFFFLRPQSAKKRNGKTTKPDVDKLLRSLLDGLTGIVFEDDSQVVRAEVEKAYGQPERAVVEVEVTLA